MGQGLARCVLGFGPRLANQLGVSTHVFLAPCRQTNVHCGLSPSSCGSFAGMWHSDSRLVTPGLGNVGTHEIALSHLTLNCFLDWEPLAVDSTSKPNRGPIEHCLATLGVGVKRGICNDLHQHGIGFL